MNIPNRIAAVIAFFGIWIALSPAAPAQEAPRYEITDLGSLGGRDTAPNDFNNAAQVVGYSMAEETGFLRMAVVWKNGVMHGLSDEAWTDSRIHGINDAGVAVGEFTLDDQRPARWLRTLVEELPTDLGEGIAYAISEQGLIAGEMAVSPGFLRHAALWDENLEPHDLGTLGGPTSLARDINDLGEVVGTSDFPIGDSEGITRHAFLYRNGEMIDLGTLGQEPESRSLGYAINNRGQVVGLSSVDGSDRPFVWTEETGMVELETFGSSSWVGYAFGINERGHIVGRVNRPGSTAVLWDDEGVHDLQELIPPDTDWNMIHAIDINEAGQIIGVGSRASHSGLRAFLLTPLTLELEGPFPGQAGTINTMTASGAVPGNNVFFAIDRRQGASAIPGCAMGAPILLKKPRKRAKATADANGEATASLFISPDLVGETFRIQAVEKATCSVSNVVVHTFE